MIDRYSNTVLKKLWSDENKYKAWLEVEILAAEAWSELGIIPKRDVVALRKNASFSVSRILEIEKETRHDVVAFTRAVSESLGEERKWVHYGLTSTDVVDTANGYLLKQVNAVLRKDLAELKMAIGEKAKTYKYTVEMGRTHGVHAEPMTFGLKLLNWYDEMNRDIDRFDRVSKRVEAGKISGAVGTFANTPPQVEKYVCDRIGLTPQSISTQVLPRDLHAEYISIIALIATSIERFATEIRGLQKTEIHEVEEYFAQGQKGSSAMPHKRNPIGSENVTGIARVLRGYMVPAYEDISLWHERDISHSSAERIILPDATTLLDYILRRFTSIVSKLTVYPQKMEENMNKSYGLIYSQRLLLKLIEHGYSREKAYDLIQPKTAKSWDEKLSFKELVSNDPTIMKVLGQTEIDDAFDYHYHLKYVDDLFNRVGL